MPIDKIRRYKWLKHYNWKRRGFSEEDITKAYDDLLNTEECMICNENRKPFHVDHCHITNKYRGILCHKCNRAIGFFNDNPITLRKAADYLDKHGKVVYNN